MEKWINFLSEFTSEICTSKTLVLESGGLQFETSKIFGLDYKLSTKYGFLEILFLNDKAKQDFLEFSNISKKYTDREFYKQVNTSWNNKYFPCRVFVENNKIQFYDLTNDLNVNEKYENRIIVLQSIFNILIDIKLKKILL